MSVNCEYGNGKCLRCGKDAVPWVRTCRAVVSLPTARPKIVGAPPPSPTEFAELPCALRANMRDEEMPACCGGTALVEVADCPRGKCTMRGVGGTVACVGCAMRV